MSSRKSVASVMGLAMRWRSQTKVPTPQRRTIRPSASKALSALRTVERLTPYCSTISASDGSWIPAG